MNDFTYDFLDGFQVWDNNGLLLPKLDFVPDPDPNNQQAIEDCLFWYWSYYSEEAQLEVSALSTCEADGLETGYLITKSIIADNDNGCYAKFESSKPVGGDYYFPRTDEEFVMGVYVLHVDPTRPRSSELYLIFKNIELPTGALIHKAQITFTAESSSYNSTDIVNLKIRGHLNADGSVYPQQTLEEPYINLFPDPITFPRTTTQIDWDAIEHWTTNSEYKSPNIACIIQEIIDIPEWESGNAIKFFIEDNGSDPATIMPGTADYAIRKTVSYHTDHAKAAKLEIWYTGNLTMNGGVKFGSNTLINRGHAISSSSDGLVFAGGSPLNRGYTPSGGLVLSGSSDLIYHPQIVIKLNITWTIKAKFEINKRFVWNVGDQPLKWYRVEGCNKFITPVHGGCDVTGIQVEDSRYDNSLQLFIQNVVARSVEEVCEQMTASRINWQLCSLKQWSHPADGRLLDNYDQCNVLFDVPYCKIPECISFCLEADSVINTVAETFALGNIYSTSSSGSIEFYGISDLSQNNAIIISIFEFTSSGSMLFSGNTEVVSSWANNLLTEVYAEAFVQNLEAVFATDENVPALSTPTGLVTTLCGNCTGMPLIIYLHHNMLQDGTLLDFVKRNGINFPTPLTMHYNKKLQSWICNFHAKGIGSDNNSNEEWRFTFEWACTDQIAGEEIDSSWKFSILVVRKNESSNYDLDTRVIIMFPPDQICSNLQNLDFDFGFKINIITNFVSNDLEVSPDSVLKTDGIGIFKSKFWSKNPNFNIRLSKNNSSNAVERQSINSIFPSIGELGTSSPYKIVNYVFDDLFNIGHVYN